MSASVSLAVALAAGGLVGGCLGFLLDHPGAGMTAGASLAAALGVLRKIRGAAKGWT